MRPLEWFGFVAAMLAVVLTIYWLGQFSAR
jgi:hypothetical protein